MRPFSRLIASLPAMALAAASTATLALPDTTLMAQLQQEQLQIERQQSGLKQEFVAYAMEHKAATACAIGTLGGVASIVVEAMDRPSRDALAGVGVICALYCVAVEPEGCLEAGSVVVSTAMRLQQLDEDAKRVSRRIALAQ